MTASIDYGNIDLRFCRSYNGNIREDKNRSGKKKLRKKKLLIFAIVIAVISVMISFAACDKGNDNDSNTQGGGNTENGNNSGENVYQSKYDYDGETMFYAEESTFQTYGEGVEVNGVKYLFEHTIKEEKRDRYVDLTADILNAAGYEGAMTINVYDDAFGDNYYVKDKEIYACATDPASADYAALLIMSIYGRYCNYGMAYGYADYILNKAGLAESSSAQTPELKDALYDMNALCFNGKYTDEEDIVDLKIFAPVIVKSYIDKSGEDAFEALLTRTGNDLDVPDAASALEEFYDVCGFDRQSVKVLYTFGGKSNEFIARTEFAEFFINDGWTDIAQTPMYEGNYVDPEFMHRDYCEVREFFNTVTEEMRSYQQFFALEEYDNSLEVVFYEGSTKGNVSYYAHGNGMHRIYLKTIMSLMHEYIHSLTMRYCKEELWAYEGLANKYSILYNSYALPFWNYERNNPDPDSPSYDYYFIYLDYIGRDIDLLIDDAALMDLYVYHYDAYDLNYAYDTATSFINYIERVYGKEKSIKYCFKGEYDEGIEGKTHEELIAEWKAYVQESCRKYYEKQD